MVFSNTIEDPYVKSKSSFYAEDFPESNQYFYFNLIESKSYDSSVGIGKILAGNLISKIANHDNNERSKFSKLAVSLNNIKKLIDFDSILVAHNIKDKHGVLIDTNVDINEILGVFDTNPFPGDNLYFYKDSSLIILSSGQQYFLKLILSLVYSIELNSLVVFDEPENFLHNEMEIMFLQILYGLLDQTKSIAIIATHSAILARESLSKHISHFKIVDGQYVITKPEIETYSNSLEKIYSYLFGDFESQSPFKNHLANLAKKAGTLDGVFELYSTEYDNDVLLRIASLIKSTK